VYEQTAPVIIEGPGVPLPGRPAVMPGPLAPVPGVQAPPPSPVAPMPDNVIGGPVASDGPLAEAPRMVPSLGQMLPGYYVEVGGVALQRLTRRDWTITQTRFDGVEVVDRTTRDFDSDFEPGIRFVMGTPAGCGFYIESSFYGYTEWDVSRSLVGNPITFSSTDFPPLAGAGGGFTHQQASFNSWFLTGAVDWKWTVSIFPTSSIILGLRTINIDDEFVVTESGRVRASSGLVDAVGVMEIDAQNRILGPQIGFETRWNRWGGRFSFDSYVKAGFGANWYEVDVDRRLSNSVFGPVAVSGSEDDTELAGFIEVFTAATYRFTPGAAFRGGWQFLAVYGYADAASQRPFAVFHPNQVFDAKAHERGYFQGPFASLEFTWGGVP
jgi:hypothetical protein